MADEVLVRDPTAQAALGTPIDHASEYASQQRAIPADLPVLEAVLSISLSEVHSWINRVGNLAGKSVLILGSGIVGYGMVIMARLAGARSVVVLGRRENRLAQSRVLGADEAFFSDPRMQQSVRSALDGGADYLLDASGDPSAFAQWLAAVIPGGTAAAFGIPDSGQYSIPLGSLPQGVKFMAPRPKEAESLDVVWRALGEGRIPTGQLITHLWRWPQDLNEAFSAVRRGDVIKGIFLWPETSYRS
jgi:threonine dehydrogenase-like Zn-dependent dehydrogenase